MCVCCARFCTRVKLLNGVSLLFPSNSFDQASRIAIEIYHSYLTLQLPKRTDHLQFSHASCKSTLIETLIDLYFGWISQKILCILLKYRLTIFVNSKDAGSSSVLPLHTETQFETYCSPAFLTGNLVPSLVREGGNVGPSYKTMRNMAIDRVKREASNNATRL